MAKVTLLDRLKMKKPALAQPVTQQSSVPASGAKQPAMKQPKAQAAAKVPGVNQKMDGNTAPETFQTPEPDGKVGRPKNDPTKALQKALTAAQKHKIMAEVNQTLGEKNLASNDPALQQTGREQQAKWGKPGDAPPPMPTAITQVKKPGIPTLISQGSGPKTSNLKVGGEQTAPLTNVATMMSGGPKSSKTQILDPDKTKTKSLKSGKSPLLQMPKKNRAGDIAKIRTEMGYKNVKSPDPEVVKIGKEQLKEAPLKEKAKYRTSQIMGALRSAVTKNERNVNDLIKTEPNPKKKKKKDPYKPRITVTQTYRDPARFHPANFIMGVLGSGSPIANRILGAARSSVVKSQIEEEWEELVKDDKFADKHIKLLIKVYTNSIDAPRLAKLLKRS